VSPWPRLAPAVLADDLRALADHGGLDPATRDVLNQAANHLALCTQSDETDRTEPA
jgi:hypothetical protein